MAQPIDDIELAWSSLRDTADTSGWRSISIATVGSCSLRAGRSFPDKSEALLAGFASSTVPAAEKLPDGQGFTVARVDPTGDGMTWLALTRNPHGSFELFGAMVADVVNAMGHESGADEQRLLRIFLGRIRAWQEFMRKGAQALSPEAEVGLIGELTLLRAIIETGALQAQAIESWVGPLDGVQDFEIGAGAMEVKATLSAAGFPAKIGSLEQLDDSTRQPLFVAAARLRQTDSGVSLPEFVQAMRLAIKGDAEAERLLSERLLAAGYFDAHADRYPRRFALAGIRVVEVGEGFPRLTSGTAPAGIMRAMYEIDLDKAPGDNVGVEGALKKLGAI
ncbi:PD-(D/E)XK motif protein [Xanthomonas campestris pv. campestris]|uniref:PD-(D/E)XK motif protein n=1 Tax=Xanthomonas campestris TaxID=339 RepID=UPI002B234A49|nr:PD-(D/E)XK motif protein [Xanthomonas campestris]MEB1262480.1 PD-(D/E)XK motif protein [Xanthomonas campestris pv. campestris]MEA9913976.1 PD-(D/E)XK motif protein [Xanthomonas campestris pv. raphani]MEB1324814.1 PD-(D/E)XK motif protein [Xanthomonas campestris pv. campestris]MEB1358284.1 PD-(D/E)XK motif protein [Xanthomonas campestris pv. campestris]MEB1424267.1 PD-(D/E)XK motif protein [Xanthomonas campestris pv. campestris]